MSIERDGEGKKGLCFLPCGKAVKAVRLGCGRDLEEGWQYMRFEYLEPGSTGEGVALLGNYQDRAEAVFGGRNTVHGGGKPPSFVLVPIIPKREA